MSPAPAMQFPPGFSPEPGGFWIAGVNLDYGGIDPGGGTSRRDQSAAAVCGASLVWVQELWAPGGAEDDVRASFRALADAAGLVPCALGHPRGAPGLRTGIMIDPGVFEVQGTRDMLPLTRDAPFWAEADLRIRATGEEVTAYSHHGPATDPVMQLSEGSRLGTRIARRQRTAYVQADWNCYSPADALAHEDIAALPRHLWVSRVRRDAAGNLTANCDVHEALDLAGLTDPVPGLPPERRDPPHRTGTGSGQLGVIDRLYVYPPAAVCTVRFYWQVINPGSDHQVVWFYIVPAASSAR